MVVVDTLYEGAAREAAAAVSLVTGGGPRVPWTEPLAASLQTSVGNPDWARLEIEARRLRQREHAARRGRRPLRPRCARPAWTYWWPATPPRTCRRPPTPT